MSLRDIPKFEKMNNLSVNEYGLTDTNKVQILKISNNYKNKIGRTDTHTHSRTDTQPPVVTAISSLPQAGSTMKHIEAKVKF